MTWLQVVRRIMITVTGNRRWEMTEARDEDQGRFRFKDRDEGGFGDRFRFGQVRGRGFSQCTNTVRRAVHYSRGKYPSYLLLAETACQVLYKYQGSTFADAKSTLYRCQVYAYV